MILTIFHHAQLAIRFRLYETYRFEAKYYMNAYWSMRESSFFKSICRAVGLYTIFHKNGKIAPWSRMFLCIIGLRAELRDKYWSVRLAMTGIKQLRPHPHKKVLHRDRGSLTQRNLLDRRMKWVCMWISRCEGGNSWVRRRSPTTSESQRDQVHDVAATTTRCQRYAYTNWMYVHSTCLRLFVRWFIYVQWQQYFLACYHPRMLRGNVFSHVCLCACLSVKLWLLKAFTYRHTRYGVLGLGVDICEAPVPRFWNLSLFNIRGLNIQLIYIKHTGL